MQVGGQVAPLSVLLLVQNDAHFSDPFTPARAPRRPPCPLLDGNALDRLGGARRPGGQQGRSVAFWFVCQDADRASRGERVGVNILARQGRRHRAGGCQ